jgi:hypothetical protein
MISYAGGVLTSFWYQDQNEVHWSDGKKLRSGDIRYKGGWYVTAMIAYTNPNGITGVLTAFQRGHRDYIILWSPDGRNLVSGGARDYYFGTSAITAMTAYTTRNGIAGVLTAFDRAPNDSVVHWSADGKLLGGGSAGDYYGGSSTVNVMIPYNGGVLTSFTRGADDNVVHRSEDGKKLGGGSARDYYGGTAVAWPMTPFKNGVLTSFIAGAGSVVHFSKDGKHLASGDVRHPGPEGVNAMLPYNGGVLTSF